MMKGNLDNFEQCEKNIKKNQDPTGGNPDCTTRNTTSKNISIMKMRKSNQNRIAQTFGEG